jgi:hypothetical protein
MLKMTTSVSDKWFIGTTLVFIYLCFNQNTVQCQRYYNRNNRPLSRSLSASNRDQTIVKVYPSGTYGPQKKTYEDAGVPPGMRPDVTPDVPPQEYDTQPAQDDSKYDDTDKGTKNVDDNIVCIGG